LTNGAASTARPQDGGGLSVFPGPLLAVDGLTVRYGGASGSPPVRAVEGVSFSLDHAETLGIVGESGSGKTTLALALLRLLPASARVLSGTVRLNGRDLLTMSRHELDRERWRSMSIAFQGAMNALNPLQPVLAQVAEPLLVHERISKQAANRRALDYLARVGIPKERSGAYPHELSGGMRQRAIIAMALVCEPELVIADEPGTALDVVVQRQVLELLQELQRELRLAMVVISHDLSVIEFMTHRCLVMYGGRVLEQGPTRELFEQPGHPYLQMLIRSFPRLEDDHFDLVALADTPVDLGAPPSGCVFHPRCPFVMDRCREEPRPPDFPVGERHSVACWLEEARAHG
jgi:oligopeptide/dipeptide ABC transporter ATP-binding protein